MPLFLDAPNLGEREKKKLLECVDSTYVSTIGPFVKEFEEAFAGFLGVESTVSVQSGTAALHIALVELGIGPGDEVIVPALTFVASANSILYMGATPVFVDVDPLTWTLDIERTRQAITEHTKAIIPVHLYGNPCDMDSLQRWRRSMILPLSRMQPKASCKLKEAHRNDREFGCFSFNGNKLITTGGGGMVVAKNQARKAYKIPLEPGARYIKRILPRRTRL